MYKILGNKKMKHVGSTRGKMGKCGVQWVDRKLWLNFSKIVVLGFPLATTVQTTLLDIVNNDLSVQGSLFPAINTTHKP